MPEEEQKQRADAKTLEELAKLPPKERIRRLRELEEQRKKEIEEIEAALKTSVRQATEQETKTEEEELEGRRLELKKREQPKILESKEEQPLEERAKKSPRFTEEERAQIKYGAAAEVIKGANAYDLASQDVYQRLDAIREHARSGYLSQAEQQFVQEFQQGLARAAEVYIKNEEVRETLSASEDLLRRIEAYQGQRKTKTDLPREYDGAPK